MFTDSDYDKLQQIMAQTPENRALIQKLLDSHKETISTISHEIRNPLTLVYSTLQLIESQHPEVITFKYWNSVKEDVEYMKQLLEELSAFNNGSVLTLRELDFRKFMEKLSLTCAVSLDEQDIEYTSYIDPLLPAIKADGVKLKQVFLNLLKNAAEAAGPKGSISLDARFKGNYITVRVKDNGPGIDPSEMPDIFTPFVTHKQGGTGLGLAIAKRIAEAHNGTIAAESVPGHGAVFTVTLPV